MNTFRNAFWAIVGLVLIVIGLANREMVTLQAMPTSLAGLLGISPDIQLPLFVVIFMGVALGLVIGFLWEWLREHRMRADARLTSRENAQLKREMDRLRDANNDGKDDVLQLLEKS